MKKKRDLVLAPVARPIRVTYDFIHSRMGFQNSVTVTAFNNEDAISRAKQEVAQTYGSKMLRNFKFKIL